MPRYRLDSQTRELVEIVDGPRRKPVAPMIMSDIKPYVSPLGWKHEVGSRSERREELKRHGCREVDPSERKQIDQITKTGNELRKQHAPLRR